MKYHIITFIWAFMAAGRFVAAQIPYPGEDPGQARMRILSSRQTFLENGAVGIEFRNDGNKLVIAGFEDKRSGNKIITGSLPLFEIKMQDSSLLTSDDFRLVDIPALEDITGNATATRVAERQAGKKYYAALVNEQAGLSVHWEASLRDGSNYIRQVFRIEARDEGKISKITLVKLPVNIGIKKVGTVDGSPMVHDNMFFALEYPLGRVNRDSNYITASLPGFLHEVSTAWGVTPVGQLRRGFLYYVERERVHPYHQVLHYNSWFDISWDDRKFLESECLDRIRVFGDSLIVKRHIPMEGFLFDDGWDDNRTLWKFYGGFPDGFDKLKAAARTYNAKIGVWLSPFGGYGNSKKLRIEYGKMQTPPFETNDQGFSLSGPVYYNRFREVTADFIRKYDICMFKFDGVGAGNGAPMVYRKDVEAFLRLLSELLVLKPDLYLSLTSGTWPSVYWLKFGDNIWRGGDDTNMSGEGSKRQQWITYRDADVYKNVVQRGPLYPLNALMVCGICIADNGNPGLFEMNEKDISDEIWSFFATGTNLQELYINPHELSTANWDCLADASRWAKENERVLADVHWTGGDPAKGEVYGFAAWSAEKAALSLRNPSSIAKTYDVNVRSAFELPGNVNAGYLFHEVRKTGQSADTKVSAQDGSFRVTLQPYEVRIFEAVPVH